MGTFKWFRRIIVLCVKTTTEPRWFCTGIRANLSVLHHLSFCSLLNSSGGILAYVGYTTEVDPRVMAAVANNITYLFERTTRWTFDGENVDMIIVACEVSEKVSSACW